MGLPDFHTVQQQYVNYYSTFVNFNIDTIGYSTIIDYDNNGDLIYLQLYILSDTANINRDDRIRLTIDGVVVSVDRVFEFEEDIFLYDTAFIYPIRFIRYSSLVLACRNRIQFNSNILIEYYKTNAGIIEIQCRYAVGLF